MFVNGVGLQPEGENGPVNIVVNEETSPIAAAMVGHVGYQEVDQTAEITTRPFDNWSLLDTLFPAIRSEDVV